MKHKIVLLTLCILTGTAILAQDEKTDAVYLEQTKEYTLEKDGSWTYHYSHKLLINTYYAFNNLYGEDFIVYDPAFQKLKINRSMTTMYDGKQVSSPANAFNEVLPGFAANIPAWNRLREMVVTHTALERGAVIDFDYTLSASKGYIPALMANEQLLMNSPVKKLTFIIHVPSGAVFNYEKFNLESKPLVVKQGGKSTYTWTLTDLPAATREDFRPREQQNRPRIVFAATPKSTDLMTGFVSQEAFRCELPSEVKDAAATATSGIDTPLLKTLRLQEKVANELNTWQVPLQYTGYKLRNVAAIWQSNGGTEAEKAILLTAMLRSQNIQAEPVAVILEKFVYTKKMAIPTLIERFLVEVRIQGMESIFLSPTQIDMQDVSYSLGSRGIISLRPGKVQPILIISEPRNLLSLSGNLVLTDDLNLKGNLTLELGGRLNPWLKIQKDSTYANAMLSNAFGNGEITDIIKSKTDIDLTSFSFKASANSFTNEKAGHIFLKLPSAPAGSESWHMTELVSTRTEPFEIPYPITETYDIFISLPEGITLASAGANLKMSNEFGSTECSVTMEGNQLHVVRKLNIAVSYVPVDKYETFRMMMNAWNSKKYREVVLKKITSR